MIDIPEHGGHPEGVPPLLQLVHIFDESAEPAEVPQLTKAEELARDIARFTIASIDRPQQDIPAEDMEDSWIYLSTAPPSLLVPKRAKFAVYNDFSDSEEITSIMFSIELSNSGWLQELLLDLKIDDLPPISETVESEIVKDYLITYYVNGHEVKSATLDSHCKEDPKRLAVLRNTLAGLQAMMPTLIPLSPEEMQESFDNR